MKLAVIGTSNSILKNGYAEALMRAPNVEKFQRTGPGGSPSVILPYFGQDIEFSNFDAVIIDTAVNDEAFLEWGLLSETDVLNNVAWICNQAILKNCRPMLLVMPSRSKLGKRGRAAEIYYELARSHHIDIIDGYNFVERIASRDNLIVDNLFIDDLHLKAEVAVGLVPEIIELHRISKNFGGPELISTPFSYLRLEADKLVYDTVMRSSSLLEVNCAPLGCNDIINVNLTHGEEICGVVYNSGHTNGSLLLKGNIDLCINVTSAYYGKNELMVLARQITPPIGPSHGVVSIMMHKEYGHAEIIGLLIRQDLRAPRKIARPELLGYEWG